MVFQLALRGSKRRYIFWNGKRHGFELLDGVVDVWARALGGGLGCVLYFGLDITQWLAEDVQGGLIPDAEGIAEGVHSGIIKGRETPEETER
jgi:hypothetical protein